MINRLKAHHPGEVIPPKHPSIVAQEEKMKEQIERIISRYPGKREDAIRDIKKVLKFYN